MTDDYITALFSGFVVAIVNIAYYIYDSHKKNKNEFLKQQITELLLPLFIQFKNMDIENPPELWYIDTKSELMVFFKNKEIKKILTDKLYLASPDLAHRLLEYIYNDQYFTNIGGTMGGMKGMVIRSTYLDDEDKGGYLDEERVLQNCKELKKAIYT